MNAEEKREIRRQIGIASTYYRANINSDTIELYMKILEKYSFKQIMFAITTYAQNPKSRFMFLAADLIEIIDPQPTDDSLSREIAAKISSAVTKFGWCNSEEAKNYIGEIGWRVIEKRGGWAHICQNLRTDEIASFDAQNRELAKSAIIAHNNPKFSELLESASKGMALPESSPEQRREFLLDQAKQLGDKDETSK